MEVDLFRPVKGEYGHRVDHVSTEVKFPEWNPHPPGQDSIHGT